MATEMTMVTFHCFRCCTAFCSVPPHAVHGKIVVKMGAHSSFPSVNVVVLCPGSPLDVRLPDASARRIAHVPSVLHHRSGRPRSVNRHSSHHATAKSQTHQSFFSAARAQVSSSSVSRSTTSARRYAAHVNSALSFSRRLFVWFDLFGVSCVQSYCARCIAMLSYDKKLW